MGRTPDVLDDPTPIDGLGVDVMVRVAWLLRMSRSAGLRGGPVSVTEMARLLREQGVSAAPPSVSGWETGRVAPSTAVVEGYERALGLEPGALRGAVDMLRRTFGVRPSTAAAPDLGAVDRAAEPVLDDRPVSGAQWLHFCDAALAVRPGLPTRLMRPLVDRLVSETSRSVFTAYLTRYEGLALLRCGQYADLVLAALRDHIEEPGNQVVAEGMSLVAELPDRSSLEVLTGYLGSDDAGWLSAAVLALENAHLTGGLTAAHWRLVVAPFVRAYDRGADDEDRWSALSALWHLLPRELRSEVEPQLRRPVGPSPAEDPRRDRHAEQELSRDLADRVCAARGLARQPLLARLVHEAMFDRRRARSLASAHVLMASPLRGDIGEQVAATTDELPPALRRATAELLIALGDHRAAAHARRWVASEDPALLGPGLVALAHVGERVAQPRLADLLERRGPVSRRALYPAGRPGHPETARLAGAAAHPLSATARWWLRHGPAVTS